MLVHGMLLACRCWKIDVTACRFSTALVGNQEDDDRKFFFGRQGNKIYRETNSKSYCRKITKSKNDSADSQKMRYCLSGSGFRLWLRNLRNLYLNQNKVLDFWNQDFILFHLDLIHLKNFQFTFFTLQRRKIIAN